MKRTFDIFCSFILLILFSPIIFIIALLIHRRLGSPVFFRQERPGLNGQIFQMIKFRTMSDLVDTDGVMLSDADRMTQLGSFLRSSSLDELPELWNVLTGNMSLVGPRPLLVEYLPLYNEQQKKRHDVRPGITGWAQINGRNALTWEDKFALDSWYISNQTFWLDIKILFLTVKKVIIREGITSAGTVSADKFTGTQ